MERFSGESKEPRYRLNVVLPSSMFYELKALADAEGNSMESYIIKFVKLRIFIDNLRLQSPQETISVDSRPISLDLATRKFCQGPNVRKLVSFPETEFLKLRKKKNMSLYVRESVALGLEALQKAESYPSGGNLPLEVGKRRFLIIL